MPARDHVGPDAIRALRRHLDLFDYDRAVDGVAGARTRAAFPDFNSIDHCA
ncbi:hypothetical protein [Streptomyces sp. Tu 3180]|uniref:hypothetical protein n=1 Tax=Streptomyces sp. Tu 3180 TaxID=2682611 RepID=UPI00135C41EF|nr:hypothetical protein [Streptomyces sp. Tu 3180]KAF3466760.1 hypothetical protein GL259_22220 [Streptomyces sp. Tu 3180]